MIKKICKIIKNNIFGFVIGVALAASVGGAVYATTNSAANLMYVIPGGAKITSNNIKGALDQLFYRVDGYKKYYYAFGDPTTSSPIDYTTLGHRVFVRISEDNIGTANKEACIIRNGELGCFKNGTANWASNQYLIQAFFSDLSCTVGSSYVYCIDDSSDCGVYSNGNVNCYDIDEGEYCNVDASGAVDCE